MKKLKKTEMLKRGQVNKLHILELENFDRCMI